MASITLRQIPGDALTVDQVNNNFSNLNTDKLEVSAFTASAVLALLVTVDGHNSGLDADTIDGMQPASANTSSTIVNRDSSGNFSANIISASFIGNLTGNVTGNLTGTASTATNALQLGGIVASSYAQLASPTLTGTPSAPTAAAGTNSTQLATTAFVKTAITAATGSLGTLSIQNANAVAITGGTITGTTVNGNVVGANAVGARTIQAVSAGVPTGGSSGDIVYQY